MSTIADATVAGLTSPPQNPEMGQSFWLPEGDTFFGPWDGQDGMLSTYAGGSPGWVSRQVKPGELFHIINYPGGGSSTGGMYVMLGGNQQNQFGALYPTWRSDQALQPLAELDPGSQMRYNKAFDVVSFPDNTAITIAHGLDIDFGRIVTIQCSGSNATTQHAFVAPNGYNDIDVAVDVDATNINIRTNWDASSYSGSVRVQFVPNA